MFLLFLAAASPACHTVNYQALYLTRHREKVVQKFELRGVTSSRRF